MFSCSRLSSLSPLMINYLFSLVPCPCLLVISSSEFKLQVNWPVIQSSLVPFLCLLTSRLCKLLLLVNFNLKTPSVSEKVLTFFYKMLSMLRYLSRISLLLPKVFIIFLFFNYWWFHCWSHLWYHSFNIHLANLVWIEKGSSMYMHRLTEPYILFRGRKCIHLYLALKWVGRLGFMLDSHYDSLIFKQL